LDLGCELCLGCSAAPAGAAARYSSWGYTPGWQREIGFWNIGLIAILIPILRRGSPELVVSTIRGLVLLSVLFGTNHAVEVFRGGHAHPELLSHVGGMVENYFAVLLGTILLVEAWRRRILSRRLQ
jgi:KinB signaling pathway activation protein